MATVYRKTVTRKLPLGAELFTRRGERCARWKDSKGKRQTALVFDGADGSLRVRMASGTYIAKYRDGQGIVLEVSTGCRSKDGALAVLKALTDRAEKVRSGIITTTEDAIADHLQSPIGEHVEAYLSHHRTRGSSPTHLEGIKIRLDRLVREVPFARLGDIQSEAVSRWLAARLSEDMAPRTRNSYLEVLKAFCNWCVQSERLASNPLAKLRKADEQTDRRIVRRSMTEEELRRLLYVTTWRPLAEFGRDVVAKDPSERKAKRDTWTLAPLSFDALPAAIDRARESLKDNPAFITELERRGRQRALVYKTLVLTGLRRGELASVTVGDIHLDEAVPYATLQAASAKNRQATEIPLRDDLVADLRAWLADKLEALNEASAPFSGRLEALPLDTELLDVPRQLVKALDRDLAVAGIPKTDDRGRTFDVHALRHSFGSLLSAGGVAPRTAQAAMRHSSIDLTMNVYTDPRVLDVRGALDALPSLPLDASPLPAQQRAKATGTDDHRSVAPTVAPNLGKRCISRTTADTSAGWALSRVVQKNPDKANASRGFPERARQDSNLQPLVPKTSALSIELRTRRLQPRL